jgi:hypothetical protein
MQTHLEGMYSMTIENNMAAGVTKVHMHNTVNREETSPISSKQDRTGFVNQEK